MIFQFIAEEQALIIEQLTDLCNKLLEELSQYKNIEKEEQLLRKLEDKTNARINP